MSSQIFPTRRTENLLPASEDLSTWASGFEVGTSVTANATTAPNGTATADRIDYSGGGTSNGIRLYTGVGSASSAGALYTSSLYLKANTGATLFEIDSNLGTRAKIVVTSSWQRFSVSGFGDGASFPQVILRSGPATNAVFSVYGWGGNITLGGLTEYAAAYADNSLSRFVVPESVKKTPVYRTIVQGVDSAQEYRIPRGSVRYRYTMELNGLDSTARDTVDTFFATHGGRWDKFQLEDPWTKALTYVRFDQDELDFEPLVGDLWHVALSFISVIG